MIPDRDYYADKAGRLTDDPTQFARQIAVKGCFLDPRVAARYGIINELVSVDEPAAPRRVTGRNAASVKIVRVEDKESEPPAAAGGEVKQPQEPAEAAAKKPTAKKEKK